MLIKGRLSVQAADEGKHDHVADYDTPNRRYAPPRLPTARIASRTILRNQTWAGSAAALPPEADQRHHPEAAQSYHSGAELSPVYLAAVQSALVSVNGTQQTYTQVRLIVQEYATVTPDISASTTTPGTPAVVIAGSGAPIVLKTNVGNVAVIAAQ